MFKMPESTPKLQSFQTDFKVYNGKNRQTNNQLPITKTCDYPDFVLQILELKNDSYLQ